MHHTFVKRTILLNHGRVRFKTAKYSLRCAPRLFSTPILAFFEENRAKTLSVQMKNWWVKGVVGWGGCVSNGWVWWWVGGEWVEDFFHIDSNFGRYFQFTTAITAKICDASCPPLLSKATKGIFLTWHVKCLRFLLTIWTSFLRCVGDFPGKRVVHQCLKKTSFVSCRSLKFHLFFFFFLKFLRPHRP